MWTYRLSDSTLRSNVPLPELPCSSDEEPEYVFEMRDGRGGDPSSTGWFHQWVVPDGGIWLRLARVADGYLLRFPDFADFVVSTDGRTIRCHPELGIPSATLRHLFLDQVFPLALSHRGRRLVHASAVASPAWGAVAFVGMAGCGKSTLAASLAREGLAVLADDCLMLKEVDGELFGAPTYPGLRLWPDSVAFLFGSAALPPVAHYGDKKRIVPRGAELTFCGRAVPLKRVYVLARQERSEGTEDIRIEALSPHEVFLTLLRYGFRLDIGDRAALNSDFEYYARLAGLPLFYRLTFPQLFLRLPSVRQAIVAHLHSG